MKIANVLCALSLTVSGSVFAKSHHKPVDPKEAILGTWTSEKGEVRPGAGGSKLYLKRQFTITPEGSSAHFTLFADETFKTETMTFDFGGKYEILKPSEKVKGATEGNFPIERLSIKPLTEQSAGFLNSAKPGTCGGQPWKAGVEQDTASTHGCSLFGIRTGETVEHDVVKVEGNKLFFGARPTDGTLLDTEAKRPTAFQVPVIRKKG